MRALVLWADDRSTNLGVRALAHGSAALVRRVWPDAEVEFQNFGRGAAPMPVQGPRSLVREALTSRAGLRRWLRGFDLVLDTRSGDSFADIYGQRRLTTMSLLAEIARSARVPVVLGPQTIGPFTTPRGRATGRWSLRRAALVMARDSVSAQYARSLGRPVDALTTDVVFALPVPEVARTHDVLLNVSGLLWQGGPHVDPGAYRATVRTLHDRLVADGRRVGLLAHVIASNHPDNDVPAIEEVAATIAPDAEVLVPTDLEDVRRMVAGAQVVVGSRMHACLNALSVGTPAVPLAYSRKFAPLLADLGWRHTVELATDPDPAASVLRLLGRPLDDEVESVRARAQDLLAPATDALAGLLAGRVRA